MPCFEVLMARFFVIVDVVTMVGSRHADTLADAVLVAVPTGAWWVSDAQSTESDAQSTESDARSTELDAQSTSGQVRSGIFEIR